MSRQLSRSKKSQSPKGTYSVWLCWWNTFEVTSLWRQKTDSGYQQAEQWCVCSCGPERQYEGSLWWWKCSEFSCITVNNPWSCPRILPRQRRLDNGYRGSLSLTSYNCMQIYSCLKLQSLMCKNEIPLLKIQVLEKLGGDSISRWEEKADHLTQNHFLITSSKDKTGKYHRNRWRSASVWPAADLPSPSLKYRPKNSPLGGHSKWQRVCSMFTVPSQFPKYGQ